MLPNVYGDQRTKREIVYYSIILVVASLALYPLHVMGAFYFAAAAVLGGVFVPTPFARGARRRDRRGPPPVSLFADLSGADVRGHGHRQNRRFVNRCSSRSG